MHRNKQIAIILPDTLQSIGLQSMLTDYFPPVETATTLRSRHYRLPATIRSTTTLQMPLYLSSMQTFSFPAGARRWS